MSRHLLAHENQNTVHDLRGDPESALQTIERMRKEQTVADILGVTRDDLPELLGVI